jgi:4-hydroxythreonine-4-phosphate dehydrogenase
VNVRRWSDEERVTERQTERATERERERPIVGITVGDPAGIGPEIARKAAEDPRVKRACDIRLYGPDEAAAAKLVLPGELSARAGKAAYEAIVNAVMDARLGRIDAVATAPVNKEAFALAGLPWKGHTDLLGALTNSPRAIMLFYAEQLRVVLATVHIAIADVPAALTPEIVRETIEITAQELPRFGYPTPRLAMAALNPHAGEHGLMGEEDDRVIAPAVAACRQNGINVTGPIPGDTVFVRALRGEFDAVIACYHDQGLIPVKMLAFGSAVNVTLGLPIIRTSVDHGTAFDIAGQDKADPSSMIQAVLLAARLAGARVEHHTHG